ncbi:unnamed protein product [Calypogeia fissa]
MGKAAVFAALWLAIAVTLALQVSALQVGPGLGKDNMTVEEVFTSVDFFEFFPNMNSPVAHAQGFYDYESFVAGASMFQEEGLFLKGGSKVQKLEIAAFLAHVAHETTCGWSGSKGGPYLWGLCFIEDLSPSSIYCVEDARYPCVNGVSYHGRGPLPVYYNYNYGTLAYALNLDLLSYPGRVANNATVAWATAMWKWVTPQKPNPSAHSVMVGEWKPTKEDIEGFRTPGFGMTINILNGQVECGHGDDPRADDRISTYKMFSSDKLAVDPGENLDCGDQEMLPFGFTAVLPKKKK